jgi:hypothetical protein
MSFAAFTGFSQITYLYKPVRLSLFGGAGLATSNNYDLGVSGGLDFHAWIHNSTYLGAFMFLQGHSFFLDNEANSAKHGLGYAGMTYRHESKYLMFCPKIARLLAHKPNFFPWLYLYGGAGFKMSGYDSVQVWDRGQSSTYPGYFDSTLDASKNVKAMILRVGFGFAQDIAIGKNWWFTFKEDFGFVPGGITTTGHIGSGSPARTPYTPNKMTPAYISLQLGITYIKGKKSK